MGVISLGSNLASLKAQRQLAQSAEQLSRSYERLGSGLRINRASDDAAGVIVSSKLVSDARVYTQAIRNANDGISALAIADGAAQQLSSVLMRLKELATHSANGALGLSQRRSLDNEAKSLVDEFNRILDITSFNGRKLLDGSLNNLAIQIGYGTNGQISFDLGSSIARTRGEGTFAAPLQFDFSQSMYQLAAGDLNGDGKADLAVANADGLVVHLGNGDGTYQSEVSVAVSGAQLTGVQMGDLNSDGHLDLVGYGSDGILYTVLNRGDGTFHSQVESNVDGTSSEINPVLGDLNGDGALDIAVVSGTNSINVMLNNGNGTFSHSTSALTISDAGNNIVDMHFGDMNGDGRLDLVTASSLDDKINILFGNGNGTFGPKVSYDSGSEVQAIALADLNHDGILDVAVAENDAVNVRLGGSNGALLSAVTYASGSGATSIETGDFNGDGYIDLFVGGAAADSGLLVNSGSGTFIEYQQVTTDTDSNLTAVADINGDGVDDMVVSKHGGAAYAMNLITDTYQANDLQRLNITTREKALETLGIVDEALDRVLRELGSIGGAQSRIVSAVNVLRQTRENSYAANSRISDIDIASEAAHAVKQRILQQVSGAVMAQANQIPQIALQLLRNG